MKTHKQIEQTLKIILISSLVSLNIVIWYGLLGEKFALAIIIIAIFMVIIQ